MVWKQLEFRPKTTHPTLRKQSIDAAMKAAVSSSYSLLAVEYFDIIAAKDKRLVNITGEEPILLECLAFASSVVCNGVNPESDEYELLLDSRQSIVPSFNQMSLLNTDEIENAILSRFDLYDKASSATDRETYLSSSNARVLTCIAGGEHFSRIKIRYEDSPDLAYCMTSQEFVSHVDGKLKEIFSRIVKREMDEEYDF
ncbi:hypothetical protein [Salinicola rhizosphaerae]|uniref:Uncharacterized protein n=1 Tax=Salinicola rhizosphaerae TaxID=1443141 RepID=A0ABQ3E555_9GAMM|nr:hypothetical protein [Salinicola rhizosphaerae]GHB26463.1 hypothetical protein GCM10009038_26390 [Salinicola rhizosphaerae]